MSDTTAARPAPTWPTATVAGAFGLLYAYFVWNALAFLISQATGVLGINGYGWFVLLSAVVFPIVAFAAAFAVARRRRTWELGAALFAGLALTAVFWLDVVAYAAVFGAGMLG
ncbi:bacitracin resistance protein [Microbacterium thalassium]|uniref:Uncharacterized protein n=1 Tax=Microbacterium thalassium TaxID=362649 RepID=A0A7X0FRI4_9MICO|nr:bacitracin resistance protein [Microbacterium thalassium]MBB6392189.1 hypothetical protein [Microbacterium thalassium]GLK23400.1 hypothetical protein GCM10017607_07180 [Microbacterium thalassium]